MTNRTISDINDTDYDEDSIKKLRTGLTILGFILIFLFACSIGAFSLVVAEKNGNLYFFLICIAIAFGLLALVIKLLNSSTADFYYYLTIYECVFGILGFILLIVYGMFFFHLC